MKNGGSEFEIRTSSQQISKISNRPMSSAVMRKSALSGNSQTIVSPSNHFNNALIEETIEDDEVLSGEGNLKQHSDNTTFKEETLISSHHNTLNQSHGR